MRLRSKISVILLSLLFLIVTLSYVGSQLILNTSFLQLEQQQANENLQRVDEAIQQVTSNVSTMTTNWAIWDDTYNFVIGKNKTYKNTNLVTSSFASADVDMMLFFN
jgi:sensor domain CHASE-containing protein